MESPAGLIHQEFQLISEPEEVRRVDSEGKSCQGRKTVTVREKRGRGEVKGIAAVKERCFRVRGTDEDKQERREKKKIIDRVMERELGKVKRDRDDGGKACRVRGISRESNGRRGVVRGMY